MNEQRKREFRALLLKNYDIDIAGDNELLPILLMQHDIQDKQSKALEEQNKKINNSIAALNKSIESLQGFQKQNVFYGDAAKYYRPMLWPVVFSCITVIILTFWFSWFKNELIIDLQNQIKQKEEIIIELTKMKK